MFIQLNIAYHILHLILNKTFGVCFRVWEVTEDRVSTLASRPSWQAISAGINPRLASPLLTHSQRTNTNSIIYKGLPTYFVHVPIPFCTQNLTGYIHSSGQRKKHLSTRISSSHGDILVAVTEHLCATRGSWVSSIRSIQALAFCTAGYKTRVPTDFMWPVLRLSLTRSHVTE